MKRKYRIQPSQKAGHSPGQFVVQYYDRGFKVWFDASGPMSERDAEARIEELANMLDAPTAAAEVKVGDQLLTTEGVSTVVEVVPTSFANKQEAVRIVHQRDGTLRDLTLWPNSTVTLTNQEE